MSMPRRPWREYAAVILVAFVCAAAWAASHGRDINWDFLNYHLYAGFAADGRRIAQDYFPASIQSYMLGYAHLPLTWAVQRGWSTLDVQVLLAAQSVPTVVAAWFIASRLTLAETGAAPLLWRVAMVVVACISPLFLTEVGTSFTDAPTAGLVLFSAGLMLPGGPHARIRPFLAGALAGLACALKFTNVPMAAATGVMALLCAGGVRQGLRHALWYAAGVLLIFVLAYGYWGVRLYMQFGNPFFPLLLNEWFRAPEYVPASVSLDRFRPLTWAEFLLRPVYMLDPVANVYTELRAPDARYLVLIVLAAVYAVIRRKVSQERRRAINAALVWTLAAWVTWLLTSGNGRYAIPLAMMAGMAATALAREVWDWRSLHSALAKVLCVALVGVQVLSISLGSRFRWDGRPGASASPYFAPRVPAELRAQAFVIVNVDTRSASWLAPFVHPDSVFISPAGQYLFKPGSPAGRKLVERLQSGLPILVSYTGTGELGTRDPVGQVASLFGLQFDPQRCHQVVMDTVHDFNTGHPLHVAQQLCPANYSAALSVQTVQRFNAQDALLDRIEDACPRLFRPRRPQTRCTTSGNCGRTYVNTDQSLMVYGDGGVVILGYGGVQPAYLGTTEEIGDASALRCPKRPGRYIPFSANDAATARPELE